MCGVFGAIQTSEKPLTVATIRKIAADQEARGRHAYGFSWIDASNRLRHFKEPGRISKNLDALDWVEGARAVIGHTRHATHGSYDDNSNNHPHPADGGWYVHNGQIPNHTEIAEKWGLLLRTDCDSEVLGQVIEQASGSLLRRAATAINLVDTEWPLVMVGLWTRPARVLIARRGNPLVWSRGYAGNIYFGSIGKSLPRGRGKDQQPRGVRPNTVKIIDLASGTTAERRLRPFTETGRVVAGSGGGSTAKRVATARKPDAVRGWDKNAVEEFTRRQTILREQEALAERVLFAEEAYELDLNGETEIERIMREVEDATR